MCSQIKNLLLEFFLSLVQTRILKIQTQKKETGED